MKRCEMVSGAGYLLAECTFRLAAVRNSGDGDTGASPTIFGVDFAKELFEAGMARSTAMMLRSGCPTSALAEFLANLGPGNTPEAVICRAEDLLLDWIASALAGSNSHPVPLFQQFADVMGPADGRSQVLGRWRMTSPYFAALVNAAASHTVEQDDVHNSSVLHPGTVVFPAVLAAAQDKRVSGEAMLIAAIAGYEAGIRVGEFLGRSHYQVFHTTGTAGKVAAAVGVSKVLGLDRTRFVHSMGSAGTQSAGLWEFLRDGADSKQLHAAKAAADGLLSAYMTADGLTGARRIFDGPQGMARGMSQDCDPSTLCDRLGTRWATTETSFKLHASCRHTHPSADALAVLMARERLRHSDLSEITAHVHQAAIDVLGNVETPLTVHQAKFSMGTVLALIAVHGKAGVEEFKTYALSNATIAEVRNRVRMELDTEVDAAYPARWLGRVTVVTRDSRILHASVDVPKGDPENTLSRRELEDKMRTLVRFSGLVTESAAEALIDWVRQIRQRSCVDKLPC